jgi:hypothetical protein
MSDINPTIRTASVFKRRLAVAIHVLAYSLFAYALTAVISKLLHNLSAMDWSLPLPPSGSCLLAALIMMWLPLAGGAGKPKAAG